MHVVARPSLLVVALPLVLGAACTDTNGSAGAPTNPPAKTCDVAASPSFKNDVVLPGDPFVAAPLSRAHPGWIKFALLECDPGVVHFQDSRSFPFHYEAAVQELSPLLGLSRSAFDAITLHASGRQALLGAVLVPPVEFPGPATYGVQLVSLDPLEPEQVVAAVEIVRDHIGAGPTTEVAYFPTFEQMPTALADEAFLAARGVRVASTATWATDDVVYAEGWAIGRLRSFAADDLEGALERGELLASDVLLVDGVPAEMPLVAGILSATPSSPSSHTSLLARSFGIPVAYLRREEERARLEGLVGRRVAMRAYDGFASAIVDVADVEGVLDDARIAEILRLKEHAPLDLPALDATRALGRPLENLGLADAGSVGGKAAGVGVLSRAIPEASPKGGALSMALWSGFLDQPVVGSPSLRAYIHGRLGGHSYPPVDLVGMKEDLEAVRDLIEDPDRTSFAPGHEAEVLALLGDPASGLRMDAKIRFRSSSNFEDAARFTAAGLYDSVSGCLADELDGDDEGPSRCDATKEGERGVFRAIRRVFASFYTERAFLSRLRLGVGEDEVGMAILVHHSFPDELELANGVATFTRTGPRRGSLHIATQLGASSVTNPESGQRAEVVTGLQSVLGEHYELVERSNLTLLGATVMDWEDDYRALGTLLKRAADRFEDESGERAFVLEFEFKKLAPGGAALPGGGLMVKQMRQLPMEDRTPSVVPFLIGGPATLVTEQGEIGNVVSHHRLKSELRLDLRSGWMDELLADGDLFSSGSLRYLDGCGGTGNQDWPFFDPSAFPQTWTGSEYQLVIEQRNLGNPRRLTVRAHGLRDLVSPSESPLLFPVDLVRIVLDVEHESPVATWQDAPTRGLVFGLEERTILLPERGEIAVLPQVRRVADGGLSVEARFDWPLPPGASAGYTAPLVGWKETTISGLTDEPIRLRSNDSQTYGPGHHNFQERFLFEPRLEPGLAPSILDQLATQGIDFVLVERGFSGPTRITTYAEGELGAPCPPATARRR